MAETLALTAAFLFALAAALQQKGALDLPDLSLREPSSLARLAGQTWWMLGTLILLTGWLFQAAALDRGRVAVIQPLLVTTVVFALPLGYLLTRQVVGRREVIGAAVIMIGLAVFTVIGDPAGGNENAANWEWAIAIVVVAGACAALLTMAPQSRPAMKAAVYGTAAGILFGLAAALTKPTVEYLGDGLGEMLSHWELYALAIAGGLGFALQQISLGTGRLAPSVATVSVANPVVGVLIGTILFEERLERPAWHVVVAVLGMVAALGGAVAISLAQGGRRAEALAEEPLPEAALETT